MRKERPIMKRSNISYKRGCRVREMVQAVGKEAAHGGNENQVPRAALSSSHVYHVHVTYRNGISIIQQNRTATEHRDPSESPTQEEHSKFLF